MSSVRRRAFIVCVIAGTWALWVCLHTYTRASVWRAPLTDYPLVAFPFASEAMARAGRAAAGALLVWLAAWQLGGVLTSRFSNLFADHLERSQFVLGVGAVALSLVFMCVAAIGGYTPRAVILVMIAAIALRTGPVAREVRAALNAVRIEARSMRPSVADSAFGVCALLAIGFALVAALAPEVEYDALWYHLWLPLRWLEAGRLVDIVPEYISLYPGNWELLNGGAMAIGGPVAAKLLHFSCMLLMAVAAVILGRRVAAGVSRVAIFAFCLCTPTVLWEGTTAYVDLALGWFAALAAVAVWRLHETGDRRWAVVAGVMAGGALGVKNLGLIALVPLAAGVAAAEFRRRRPLVALGTVLAFGAIALVLALPWYARAFAASGNPVFPELYGVFGARPALRWSDGTERALERFTGSFGMGRSSGALAALPWNVTTHAARFGGSLGPVFLILLPLAALARERRRLAIIGLGTAAYVALWASPLGSFQLRFLMPIVPCCAVLAAAGGHEVVTSAARVQRQFGWLAVAGMCLLLVLNLPPFMPWHERERRGWEWWLTHVPGPLPAAVVTGAESEDSYLARRVPTFRAWRALDTAPADSRVLTFVGGDHLYGRRPRIWSDSTLAYPATWGALAGDESAMLAALRRLGITHVLFDKGPGARASAGRLAIASERTRVCCLVPFYEDERIRVYRVSYPPGDAVPLAVDSVASGRAPTTRTE